ncbi:hypothetical protein JCM16303_003403 [Sporobolomyces ruberrimus]
MSTTTAATTGSKKKRGALIIFEGLDRSGKSTQLQRLYERLQGEGRKVKKIGFPDRTSPTGLLINSYLTQKETKLSDEAIHLLFSANRWEKAEEIKKDLESGTTILCDRYAFSGIAFSVIKGLSWSWCKSPDIGLPTPDLTIFLSLSPETAQKRSGFGNERYETKVIQDRVREVFGTMGRECEEGVWREVSAEGEIEEVQERVIGEVEKVWDSERLNEEVGKLWVD